MARFPRPIASAVCLLVFAASAPAVILYRTGDPAANTTAPPADDVAASGWNYEGVFGGFLGSPIAPHYFITAQHIGLASNVFSYHGTDYRVVNRFADPQSDLTIYQVDGTLPDFAPLYSRTDEVGQRIVAIGRGTQRGDPVVVNGATLGWLWGPGDGVKRWGENVVGSVLNYAAGWDLLRAPFDQDGLPNECTLSAGDSGGAVFINDNGVCKLVGIIYAVDGPFAYVANPDPNSSDTHQRPFNAAVYDARGLYAEDGNAWTLISDAAPVPAGFYPTRISTKLAWICSVVAAPVVGHEANFLTFTYTKLAIAEVTYTVEQSTDMVNWTAAATADQTISTSGSASVIKASIDISKTPALFLRLRTTQP